MLAAALPLATLIAVEFWSQLQSDRAAAAGALTIVGTLALTVTIAWLVPGPIVRLLQQLGSDATEMAAGDLSHRTSDESLRLQQISTVLIQQGNLNSLYDRVLDAAIGLMSADLGSMQTFHPDQRELRLLASRGFHPASAAFWERVHADSASACGMALSAGRRIIAPDIEACDSIWGTGDLEAFRQSNIRAVQSTPLVSRSGRLLGMISTHWREPHRPCERELRLLDVLARQAADLIERNQVETALRESEERFRWLASIVESSDDAIIGKNLDGIITSWNKGAERVFGYTAEEAVGRPITILIPQDRRDEERKILGRIWRGQRVDHFETARQCKDGRLIVVSLTISPVKNAEGRIVGASKIARDITAQRRVEQQRMLAEKRIAHMAHHDALTDLPNRVLLRERLEQELAYVRRGGQLAVLYLDLDHFKSVNDTLGHSTGDELLKAAGNRLRGCLRDADFIARLGGDEFAIIQTTLEQLTDAAVLAQRVRDEMIRAPFELNGHHIVVDISIGIAVAPNDGTDPDQLLKSADMALYGAKSEGRGTYRYFESDMDARMKARRTLEVDLRRALANAEFEVYYQPVVSLQSNKVSGCESLLRWHHPACGIISPAEFIPVAEDTGLIIPIGEWVLRQACTDAATWPDDINVAVNVSPVQLRNETWTKMVVSTLAASGLPPHRLELEITESVLMLNNEATLRTLHQLRELGVRIALDDFGTRYSSLSYLRSFPFNRIKIDRSFIDDLSNSIDSLKIVQAVAGLASGLNMITTAEGIETEQQLEIIRAVGCTEMQGHLFSPPRPVKEILELISPRTESVVSTASAHPTNIRWSV
jgi:diguanylate cyclase (GGDEF)-like protein/PAS domain S-box-containing protein